MSQQRLLNIVLDVCQSIGMEYMLTGSWASSLQGQPRSTHDLDLVVRFNETLIPALANAFPAPDYYLSESSMREATQQKTMFNLLDNQSGDKVDFWILTDEPWDASRFSRRVTLKIGDRDIQVSSPEDTVLAKLRWSAFCGGSERQFKDALHVCELQWDTLDRQYLDDWSKKLEIYDAWQLILTSVDQS